MRLGVIGGGTVGKALARAFIEHVDEVRVYDVVRERATHRYDQVMACDLIMIALPTPQKEGSLECDTSIVEEFFNDIAEGAEYHWRGRLNLVIRSTVPVGFTRRMREKYGLTNLVHSPEFLTARVAVTDAQLPARNVIGIPSDAPMFAGKGYNQIGVLLRDLYHRRFPGVPCIVCTSDESELIKLGTNGFFAHKISYWNALKGLVDAQGADFGVVMAGILADGRISHSHTKVSPDGRPGYGGACLRKDSANLIACMQEAGIPCGSLLAMHEYNEAIRGKE